MRKRIDRTNTELRMICSVWILTKTRGTPEERAAVNQAIHLDVVA